MLNTFAVYMDIFKHKDQKFDGHRCVPCERDGQLLIKKCKPSSQDKRSKTLSQIGMKVMILLCIRLSVNYFVPD